MTMEPIISDKTYTEVISNALDTAKETLKANDSIFEKVLPSMLADDTARRGSGVTFMMDEIKHKVLSGDTLAVHEISTVNRALNEYVQKIELAQSHFMYMNEDMSNLQHFKTAIKDIHHVQMQFTNNCLLAAKHGNDLDDVKSRLNARNRPQ